MIEFSSETQERIVRQIQQATDPNGLAIQVDWEYIEPLLDNAMEAVALGRPEDTLSQIQERAIQRVIRAINVIFFGS